MMVTTVMASEKRHARSAICTIQAFRRSVVDEVCASGMHLGETRQTMLCDRDGAMSHISDMLLEWCASSATTLRMVLCAPNGTSHASGMMRLSVLEEKLLLDFYAVLGQKLTVFLGKRFTSMVLFLLGDIAYYHVFVTQTIRKARIFLRPSAEKREMRVGFEPFAGRDFDFLNKLGHCQSRWQGYKKMHMVRHTTDTVKTASYIVDKTKHIGIEFSLMFLINGWDASMGTKDNMIIRLRVTHAILTMNNTDYCNTSPRRGDTHKVQLTPYKRSVVWWTQHTSEAPCGDHTMQADRRHVVTTPYKRSVVW